jgi:hypothetical protein
MNNLNPSRNLAALARTSCYLFLLVGWLVTIPARAACLATTNTPAAIPWNQIGAKAGANYEGDGLAVTPTGSGARLHCVFQRLDGEATPEGLWLTSTVTNTVSDHFRVTALAVGRQVGRLTPSAPGTADRTSNIQHSTSNIQLENAGIISVAGQTVRFTRPGLMEEYSVSMDGVRQDFLVQSAEDGGQRSEVRGQRSEGRVQNESRATEGELVVTLAVTGARVEPTTYGAQLVLENSGRKIAYSRVHATDANGKELPARIEVREKAESRKQKAEMSLAVVVNDAEAVYPVRIDPTFSDANWVSLGGFPGASSSVYAAVTDGSGNLYIGGQFTVVGNTVANYIAEWNGSSWSALGSGMNIGVYALAVSGGTLYAGGSFTTAGGIAATNIAQWNGSSWSALGSGMSGLYGYAYVSALAVSGSTLYAGGNFTSAGGSAANYIAQWNGTTWSALGSGMNGNGYYGLNVSALAVSGSTLYAGGEFTNAGGSAANNIAQWNGSSWSALGSGIGDEYGGVGALAVSGSTLYAGGFFTKAGSANATNIAKWNGSSWSALGSGMSYTVSALAVSGSTLYAGGSFTTAGGSAVNYIAQWNGTTWSALGSGMSVGYGYGTSVGALAVSGNTLFAGGYFTTAGGTVANSIAKWNGTSWSALGSGTSGLNNQVNAVAVSGSTLYAGGIFTSAGGSAANFIAQWNGSSWSALGTGMSGGYNGPQVNALAVSGGTLYAGGNFTTAGSDTNANDIAQWNGNSWSALGAGMNGDVYALAVSGSTLYAGGNFTTAGSDTNANDIAQWNGNSWSALGSGISGYYVEALAVSGSTLYAGGNFTTAGSDTNANDIAQWNGSSWSSLGSGMNSDVSALAVSGGTLYAGGDFTTAGSDTNANDIAQWNGSSWSSLGSGMNSDVYALAVSGSTLYAGGYFTTAGGSAANYIAQWNGSSWSALGSGMSIGNDIPYVSALAVSGSTLYAGGEFQVAGGKVSAFVAEAYLVAPPGGLVDSIVSPSSGTADVRCCGNPGQQFGVQRTTNLSPPLWTNLNPSPLIPAPDGSFTFADTNAPPSAAFYRAFQY